MTYNILYQGTSPDVDDTAVFHFPNQEAGDRWTVAVRQIKDHIGRINGVLEQEGRLGMGVYGDYGPWLTRCRQFIATYVRTRFGTRFGTGR